MTPTDRRDLRVRTDDVVHAALERGRADGRLDRRDFMRLASLGLGASLLAACGSRGPSFAQSWLRNATRFNERLERWLFDPARLDRGSPGALIAGRNFPGYFVSMQAPVWDDAANGAWMLQVGGAVRRPQRFTLAELAQLPQTRQRVNHFCVEGWNAVAIFGGVPFVAIAQLVQPTSDAHYVDFDSFDAGYHESWDIESALHPQTLIVTHKEDQPLDRFYGAPARLHSPVKLGYKNTKYLTRITFMPSRNGGYWSDRGYEWYGGT